MDLTRDILFVLWVFAPAGIANMVPILAAHIPGLTGFTAPIDGGKTFRGKRIFGDHKTWRGLLSGIVAATAVLAFQQYLAGNFAWFAWISQDVVYADLPLFIVGPLFALGALGGDAIKSFFKRQIGVAPGKTWIPFDQIDYIIGGALAVLPFIHFTMFQYLLLVLIWLMIVLFSTWLGYHLKLKDSPI